MMSVSPNLLAFFTPESASGKTSLASVKALQSTQALDAQAFSDVLSGQQREQLASFLSLLNPGTEGADAAAKLDPAIAGDGKTLPDGMQEWLEQLSQMTLSGETEGLSAALADPALASDMADMVEDWASWLNQARAVLQGEAVAADAETEGVAILAEAEAELDADGLPQSLTAGFAGSNTALASVTPALSPDEADPAIPASLLRRSDADPSSRQTLAESALDGRDSKNPDQRRMMLDAANAPTQSQRGQDTLVPTGDVRSAAFAAGLAEALESTPRRSKSEAEGLEALLRPGSQSQAAAQGALSARPVLATAQTLGVPFGQPSWGEALMDKMLWMSSQNLRSVEIRLDPAELGPLEIHIQSRGQEHQVQFVSQNPSVREALEAQMFRLREAFSQQGMDLVDVSVGDSAVGQGQEQLAEQGRGGSRGGSGGATDGDDVARQQLVEAASQVLSDRLVDYYA
ncbi:MAG: hypothetical protein CVV07_00980 [Gammaproteobacteria bacterium HGW-Gammaproteobacteria-11]|nr:MAG: hypothetical protein CVV07_00980 [Gammaproteobacteria bacterium HGW-Gammaproteobacteria-11]